MAKDRHAGNKESAELIAQTGKGVIRASSIATYARCKWSYFLRYLVNLDTALQRRGTTELHLQADAVTPIITLEKEEEANLIVPNALYEYKSSAVAALGTAIHKAMEVGINYKIATKKDPELNLLINEAKKEWKQLLADATDEKGNINLYIPESKADTIDSLGLEIDGLVEAYHSEILPFIENPTETEGVYRVEVSGNPLIHSIQGSVDVEQSDAIRDLKVTAKKTQINRHIMQLSVYAWIREQSGRATPRVFIDNLSRNKRGVSANIMEAEAKSQYIERVLNDMLSTVQFWYDTGCVGAGSDLVRILEDPQKYRQELDLLKIIFSGSNPSDNFLCTAEWCGAYNNCPFVKGWDKPKKEIEGEPIDFDNIVI